MSPCNKDGSKGAAAPQKPMGRSPAPPHHRRCSEARMLPARPPAPSRTRLRPSRHTELFQVLKILLSLQFLWTAHGCLPLSRCPEAPSWPGVARSGLESPAPARGRPAALRGRASRRWPGPAGSCDAVGPLGSVYFVCETGVWQTAPPSRGCHRGSALCRAGRSSRARRAAN